jgi:outer membrane murein-binding lipoprotein Lpp
MKLHTSALLLMVIALTGCSREQKQAEAASKAPEPLAVQTMAARSRVVDRSMQVTGSLMPDETA